MVPYVHGILDTIGFFPEPLSTLSDVINTLMYVAEQIESALTGSGDSYFFDIICGALALGLVGVSASILKTFLSAPIGKITSNADAVIKAIKDGFGSVANFLSGLADKVASFISNQVDQMLSLLEGSYLFKVFDKFKNAIAKMGDDIVKFFNDKADELSERLNKVEDSIVGAGCLVAGTLIKTSEGYKAIETIKTGDFVYSKNTENGTIELKEVYGTYVGFKQELYTLYTSKGVITATEEHPFWVKGKGWVEAKKLTTSDRLEDMDGQLITIGQIQHDATKGTKIFNVSVTDNHNYFVGTGNILTHNINCAQLNPQVKNILSDTGEIDLGEYQKLLDDIASGKISKEEAALIKSQIAELSSEKGGKYADELGRLDDVIEGVGDLDELLKTLNLRTVNSTELIDIVNKSPQIGKELISKISKEFGTSIKSNPLRQAYENEVTNLSELVKTLKAQGNSEEAIARQLSQARRDLGVKYKDLSPQLLKEYIYDVNINRYEGDPLGGTVEYFLKKGKSWSDIIDSSCRPNVDIDILLGEFEKWMITKCNL